MSEIEGFILAGGASSRMGRDKARLELGGETFTARVARALGAVCGHVSVVGARPAGAEAGLPVVPDIFARRGALGGLHAALAAGRAPWAAVVSCDLPFVSGELWTRLAALRAEEFAAVVPLQRDGRVQPLCALYARAPCLGQVEEMLRAGELRPRALLQRVPARLVAPEELADLTDADLLLMNVNTPADYRKARMRNETAESRRQKAEGRRQF